MASANYCNVSISEDEKNRILTVMGYSGAISILVCLVSIAILVWFKLYKFFSHRLALYQVLAAIFVSAVSSLNSLTIFFDKDSEIYGPLCQILGFLLQYSFTFKLCFTAWLVFHLFAFTVCYKDLKRLELVYVSTAIVCPLILACIPFINSVYGLAGVWCWIRNWKNNCATENLKEGVIEQFVLLYVPLYTTITLETVATIIIVTVLIWRAYRRNQSEYTELINRQGQRKRVLKELLPLLAYPVVFYVMTIPALVDRLAGATSSIPHYDLLMVHGVVTSTYSFFVGLTLIIHICVLKWPKTDKNKNTSLHSTVQRDTVEYTSYTIASTENRTEYNIPPESVVDDYIEK